MSLNKTGPSLSSLTLRICLGGMMFLGHGLPKLNSLIKGGNPYFPDPIGVGPYLSQWMAVGSEVGCAILIILGLKMRWTVLPLIFSMLVAAFVVHSADPFFPVFHRNVLPNYSTVLSPFKEYALLYAFGFIALFLLGPGRYSVDHWIKSR